MIDISVVVICGKDRGFLREAVKSAVEQEFKGKFEVIVQVDEGKTMAQNTNIAVSRAKGEYVKWLHDDDLLLPGGLAHLWEAYGADVIVSNVEWFGDWYEDSPDCYLPADLEDFIDKNPINQAGTMYKRSVLVNNPLDESLWTAEEYELNLRLWSKGCKFQYVDRVTAKYRIHPEMKSGSAYWYKQEDIKAKRKAEIERIRDIYRQLL